MSNLSAGETTHLMDHGIRILEIDTRQWSASALNGIKPVAKVAEAGNDIASNS